MTAESSVLSTFERTKLCDFLFALPVIGWFVYCIVRSYPSFQWLMRSLMLGQPDAQVYANLAANIAVSILAVVLIGFLIMRRPPVAKMRGLWPRMSALLGSFLTIAIWGLPKADISTALGIVSALLIFVGAGFAVYAALYLGKSFSVMPEARRLVTGGPFALIRHPVYLGEEIALVGVMLQYVQPWSFIVLLIQLGWQITRMSYEERVLEESFPEYVSYRARTARLIPGVY